MNTSSREQFWNEKILGWENDRYPISSVSLSAVANSSVQWRQAIALEMLLPLVKGRKVVELGCGSARLLPSILEAGALSYRGIDISNVAIEKAKLDHAAFKSRCELHSGDAVHFEIYENEIVFSLGLLDWLNDSEISVLAAKCKGKTFLHSFSEKRKFDLLRKIHEAYVFIKYGHRTSYVPRYQTEAELREKFGADSRILRDRRLRFGAFIHSGMN